MRRGETGLGNRILVKRIFGEFQKTEKEKPLETVTKVTVKVLSPKALSTETKMLFLELQNCDHKLENWSLSFVLFFFFPQEDLTVKPQLT